MRNKLFLLFILIFPISIYSQQWEKIEGTATYVNDILLTKDNTIYVAADFIQTDFSDTQLEFPNFGWGYYRSIDGGANFEQFLGGETEQFSVFDIYIPDWNDQKIYLSVRKLTRSGIISSNNLGESFDNLDFDCESSRQIMDIISLEQDGNYRFLNAALNTSSGLVISEDDYENCYQVDSLRVSARQIRESKIKEDLIFLTGDNDSRSKIYRSNDGGLTWQGEISGFGKGIRVHCVLPSSKDAAVVFAGCDSVTADNQIIGKGIYRSLDTGRTWQQMNLNGVVVYEIEEHPVDFDHLAAACGEMGVYLSKNNGEYWEPENDGFPENADVRHIEIINEDILNPAGYEIYAGLSGEGLFKSNRIIASVDESIANDNFEVANLFPLPANEKINIEIIKKDYSSIIAKIYDMMGKELVKKSTGLLPKGTHLISFENLDELNSGMYLIIVTDGINSKSLTFTISK